MLSDLLTVQNAEQVAKEIVDALTKGANSKDFDYDFHINPKTLKMVYDEQMLESPIEEWEPNSNYQFDAASGTTVRQIVDAIRAEEEISEDDENSFVSFLYDIRTALNTHHRETIASVIRKSILKQEESAVPMTILQAINVEIGPLPDPARGEGSPYLISIQKVVSKEKFNVADSVSKDLTTRFAATGMDPNEIIKERKAAGDEAYANVVAANLKKIAFEVRVDWFVDYSMSMPSHEATSDVQA